MSAFSPNSPLASMLGLKLLRGTLFILGLLMLGVWSEELVECWGKGWLQLDAPPSAGKALWLYIVSLGICLGLVGAAPVLGGFVRSSCGHGLIFRESAGAVVSQFRLGLPVRSAFGVPLFLLFLFGLLGVGLAWDGKPAWAAWLTTYVPGVGVAASAPPCTGAVVAFGLFGLFVVLHNWIEANQVVIQKHSGAIEVRSCSFGRRRAKHYGVASGLHIVASRDRLLAISDDGGPALWLVIGTDDGFIPVATNDIGWSPCFSEKQLYRLHTYWTVRLESLLNRPLASEVKTTADA